ncbi:MAG: hypothetical protein M3R25_07120 [Bacteroidota bacterium]|nr:hypothetical protein [Bacteroidota bacterium]
MKVRLQGNTIRLRLKMHETDRLFENGMIEDVLEFGPGDDEKLRFQIIKGDEDFAIVQEGLTIGIVVPGTLIDTWTKTDLVGFEESITTSKGIAIKVLIEKDFACLDGVREEEEGSYTNPEKTC